MFITILICNTYCIRVTLFAIHLWLVDLQGNGHGTPKLLRFAIQCMVLYHNVITEMVFYNN